MRELLNSYQRAAVIATLRGFEESLRHALEWLNGKEVNSILSQQRLRLEPQKQAEARRQVETALMEIATLSQELNLNSAERDVGIMIRSKMSVAWTNLLDTRTKKLRGYGEVHPHLAEILDPRLLNLSNHAIKLANIFEDADASGENHE